MTTIAIQDANILIDLYKIGLLENCMRLNYRFCTTDIIFAELYDEQCAFLQTCIAKGQFYLIAITEDELTEIKNLSAKNTQLSEQDFSAYYYAEKQQAILLTGDQRLKKLALANAIEVHGILWVFDEMVACSCLSKENAIHSLQLLITKNKRIPVTECEVLLQKWKADK